MNEKHLEPLNSGEREALAALCGLDDAGLPLTAIEAARWLDVEYFELHPWIYRVRIKGWIRDGGRLGKATRLLIVARPMNIEKQHGYQAATRESDIHRHPEDRPAARACLCCGAKFRSEGWGNRLCKKCRKADGGLS